MRTFLLFLLVLAHRLPGSGSHIESAKTFSPAAARLCSTQQRLMAIASSKARVCAGQVQLPIQRTASLRTMQAQPLGSSVTQT